MKNILLSLFLVISFVLPFARPAQALGPLIDSSVLSDTDCVGPACQYSLNTFMKLGINVANIILGIVGAVALVVFVYGGIRMMASGGNAEAVSTGKKSIVGAVIGLLLVFGSYSLISFTVNTVLKADGNYQFSGNINAEVPIIPEGQGQIGVECKNLTGAASCIGEKDACTGGVLKGQMDCGANKQCCSYLKCGDLGGECLSGNTACTEIVGTNACARGSHCCKPNTVETCSSRRGSCEVKGKCGVGFGQNGCGAGIIWNYSCSDPATEECCSINCP